MCCTRLAGNAGPKKSPSGHHRTTLSGYIFAIKAHIDNRKKLVKQQYLLHMSLQYGELQFTSGWDRFLSLGNPCKFLRVSRLGSVTARHSSIGRQPNFAALNRGRHLYAAGRPSRLALAHIYSYRSSWCFVSFDSECNIYSEKFVTVEVLRVNNVEEIRFCYKCKCLTKWVKQPVRWNTENCWIGDYHRDILSWFGHAECKD